MTRIEVRDAIDADAQQACEVMQRSIRELCGTDHGEDPDILARWLANKRPDVFRSWIVQPGNSVMVAIEQGTVLAVGVVTDAGEITLNTCRRTPASAASAARCSAPSRTGRPNAETGDAR